MKTSFLFCCRPSISWPVVYKSQERWEPSIMSESDTRFNERDQRCAAVQLMLSTDPSYDNRTIASTLKMQIRTVQRLRVQLNALDDPLEVVEQKATSCHLTSSKSAWKSTPKCTWMCWRVWWSPVVIRWSVADPGCGSRTRHRPTSPKRPRLVFRRSATTFVSFSHWPPAPCSGFISRQWLRLEAATLSRCQLYNIIKLPELIFSIKDLK